MAKPVPPQLRKNPSEAELRAYTHRLLEYEQALTRWEASLQEREEEFEVAYAGAVGVDEDEEIVWEFCPDCGGMHPMKQKREKTASVEPLSASEEAFFAQYEKQMRGTRRPSRHTNA
jgi:hypothetical protein